jgi:hypothetical protein
MPFSMPRFLFQPDSIDGYEFNPIPIDIHLGILKIPTEEILDDFGINTTESVIVGTDRQEVLNRIQSAFAREFEQYGKLKESDSRHFFCIFISLYDSNLFRKFRCTFY